ncbi:MAG TPA: asparagine synthase-related protein, partial [Pyrinomonadaceae bacterium]|nr:asparagine synthase-related protein [Pyrinomonadaceae bacterium]
VSPQLADLLARFQVRSLHRQVKLWSELTRRSYGETLWNGAIVPLLPQSLRARFDSTNPSTLIHPKFARRARVNNENSRPWRFSLPSDRIQAVMLSVAIQAVASCYYRDRVVTEYRFPFLHRPLVEFLLAIPIDQKIRPTENRSLQRRALKHLLPETILKRQSKRWPTEALCRTLANNWREVEWLFQEPRVCEYGFVDATAFAAAAKRVRHGLQNVAGELSLILSIELWLRALESRRRSPATSVVEPIDEVVFQVAGSAV